MIFTSLENSTLARQHGTQFPFCFLLLRTKTSQQKIIFLLWEIKSLKKFPGLDFKMSGATQKIWSHRANHSLPCGSATCSHSTSDKWNRYLVPKAALTDRMVAALSIFQLKIIINKVTYAHPPTSNAFWFARGESSYTRLQWYKKQVTSAHMETELSACRERSQLFPVRLTRGSRTNNGKIASFWRHT